FAHCNKPIPDPRSHQPHLPEVCATIIRKAMAKEPANRFQSADEMRSALEKTLHSASETVSIAFQPSRRRWPWLLATGVAALAIFLVVFVAINARKWFSSVLDRNSTSNSTGSKEPMTNASNAVPTGADDRINPLIPLNGRVIHLGGKVRAVA